MKIKRGEGVKLRAIFVGMIAILFAYNSEILAQQNPCPSSGLITECCEITQSGIDYTLQKDVYSNGTCFQILASNFEFDLNNNTINYAQTESGHGFYDHWANRDNITITNGSIVGGRQESSNAIWFQTDGSHNLIISNLNVFVGGPQSQGILVETGNNLIIDNVKIEMDSSKNECSHYGGHIKGIGLTLRGGKIEITNNEITGKGMAGIAVSDCGSWGASTPENSNDDEPMLISGNYVSMESPINDGYAISLASLNNRCSDGTVIENNIIDQINGRGIAVAGWNLNTDHGPGNVEIAYNTVSVQEGSDCETQRYGAAIGLRIRFGAHDVFTHHNYIWGYAGPDAGVDHYVDEYGNPIVDGGSTLGIFLSSGNPYGVNNVFEDNYVEVHTTDSNMKAVALEVGGGNPNSKTMQSYFRNNEFVSNNKIIRISGGSDGQGYNVSFDRDKIVMGSNPFNFESITLGAYWWGISNIDLLDVEGENGADVHDITFYTCSGDCDGYTQAPIEDIYIRWTLNTRVEDNSGNPLDAYVTIESGGSVYAEGPTVDGFFSVPLIEKSYAGGRTVLETIHPSYNMSVNYQGNMKTDNDFLIGETTTKVFKYTEIDDPDITPPVLSEGSPRGTVSGLSSELKLSVKTNEHAQCKYADASGLTFSSMNSSFSTEDGLQHNISVSAAEKGKSYTYYVRCMDANGIPNIKDYEITFWLAAGTDREDPNTVGETIFAMGGCANLGVDADSKSYTLLVLICLGILLLILEVKLTGSIGKQF